MNTCCFCKRSYIGYGNSTWPVYPDADHTSEGFPNGEQMRCCDSCNTRYVIPARLDRTKIMGIREQFGIKTTNQ